MKFVRTTGGLFEGLQKGVKPRDFSAAVALIERYVVDDATKKALGLDKARIYARMATTTVPTRNVQEKEEILDLERSRTVVW